MAKKPKKGVTTSGVVASNRRARREYEILDTYECGMSLRGSEVKSLRDGKAQLAEAYAKVRNGEVWVHGLHIPTWTTANDAWTPEPGRTRKLLLHRAEIDRLASRIAQERLTLVPLSIYFKDGRAKMELALVRGKKLHDKRQTLAKRTADMEARKAMSDGMRRRS